MRRYLGLLFRYRGREGTIAWAFHRISGVGVWLFVILHVIDIYLIGGNPAAYDELLAFYASPVGRVMEVLLGAALLYHALNGMRIIIIDLWPAMTVHHRKIWWANWIIFFGLGIPGAAIILLPLYRDQLDGLLRTLGVS
ncbi:MAG: succinate dehydrogenase, cytochrome b556 subunit [Chloroflexi bacterium]|nr:succinate dehydrogenase, cytochrome b556 subunit [Chloroflexota bacterium]